MTPRMVRLHPCHESVLAHPSVQGLLTRICEGCQHGAVRSRGASTTDIPKFAARSILPHCLRSAFGGAAWSSTIQLRGLARDTDVKEHRHERCRSLRAPASNSVTQLTTM